MKLHPLTPRQPKLLANTAKLATVTAISAGLFLFMMTLFPLIGWDRALDAPGTVDTRLLLSGTRAYFRFTASWYDPLGSLTKFLDFADQLWSALSLLGIALPMTVRLTACLLVGVIAGDHVRRILLADVLAQPAVAHVKGPRLLSGRAAIRSLAAAWFRRFGKDEPGIELADGLKVLRSLESEHILLAGGTGAGKTTIMEKLMDGAIKRGDRLLALDVKGDVTARFPTDAFDLLSLDDARSSHWVLGLDIATPEDAVELATEIIPDTSDPSWSAGARQVLTAIITRLQSVSTRRNVPWSWIALDRVLSRPVLDLHKLLKESDPVAASLIDVAQDETRRQAMSFYFVLIANAGHMARAFAAMGNPSRSLSIRQWAHGSGAKSLILRQSRTRPALSAAMVRIIMKIVADQAGTSQSDSQVAPQPTWLFLDEFPQLGRSAAVQRLAAIGRSLGVRLVLAIQSPAQLREIYGSDGAQHLLDNLTTKIIGRVASGSTALEISDTWIGKRTVSWREETGNDQNGRPLTEQRTQEIPVVDPAFLANELGLSTIPGKKPRIRALVIGHGDIAMLTWKAGLWQVERAIR